MIHSFLGELDSVLRGDVALLRRASLAGLSLLAGSSLEPALLSHS